MQGGERGDLDAVRQYAESARRDWGRAHVVRLPQLTNGVPMLFKRESRGRSASFRIVNGVALAGHGLRARARCCSRRAVKAEGGARPALLDLVLEAPVGADAGGDRADLQPLNHEIGRENA